MKSTVINPELLAQHLELAATVYRQDARNMAKEGTPRLQDQFNRQAEQCSTWAEALRNAAQLGFAGNDIEVVHH